jgi:hypothetical protein
VPRQLPHRRAPTLAMVCAQQAIFVLLAQRALFLALSARSKLALAVAMKARVGLARLDRSAAEKGKSQRAVLAMQASTAEMVPQVLANTLVVLDTTAPRLHRSQSIVPAHNTNLLRARARVLTACLELSVAATRLIQSRVPWAFFAREGRTSPPCVPVGRGALGHVWPRAPNARLALLANFARLAASLVTALLVSIAFRPAAAPRLGLCSMQR